MYRLPKKILASKKKPLRYAILSLRIYTSLQMIRPASHSQIAAMLAALDVKISKILYFLLSSGPQHIDSISKNALDDLSDQGN